jgi:serine protease Do
VLARDRRRDLAAIVTPSDAPLGEIALSAVIGQPTTLRPGDLVVALGNPLGIVGALALGVVHAVDPGKRGAASWIRADIRLAPGNSGGPLADARGRVVGINTMIAGGLGIAVPVSAVERFLEDAGLRARLAESRAA